MSKPVAALGPCSQCGKPSVVETGGLPVCVDCWYKCEVARTMAFRLNTIAMNHALDEMDNVTGLPLSGARMQVPEIPKGPPILNNIKVDNSVVGSINTGNVRAIDVNLTYLHSAGNDKARDALKALTEAVVNDTSITDAQKNELIDQITFLSEQTVAGAKDRKPGLIKATFSALTEGARTVSSMAGAWQAAEPVLRNLFS